MGSLFKPPAPPKPADPVPLPVVDDAAVARQKMAVEAKRSAAGRAGTYLAGALGTPGGGAGAGVRKTTLG